MYELSHIAFHGKKLTTLEYQGILYTAIKPICENIGIDWESQRQRVTRDEVLSSTACMIKVVAQDKKSRNMLCLPIHFLNGWLFGIDVKRVKESVRDTLIMYKKECYQVLHDYWHQDTADKGYQGNMPSTTKDRKGLIKACNQLATQKQMQYQDVWKLVHAHCNVAKASQLTKAQVTEATKYIHSLLLPEDTAFNAKVNGKTVLQMSEVFSQAHGRTNAWLHEMYKQIEELGGTYHNHPPIDDHAVWMSFVKDILTRNRWMVSISDDGEIQAKIVPRNQRLVNFDNLPELVKDPEYLRESKVLPLLNACVRRIANKGLPDGDFITA